MSAYVIALFLAFSTPQTGVRARDAKAIQAAKNTSVHRLDSSVPEKPFGEWLQGLAGPEANIQREVNDCGEQTGNPRVDKGRDFPICNGVWPAAWYGGACAHRTG